MSLLDQLLQDGEDIAMFGDSDLYQSPEYDKVTEEISALRRRLLMGCGKTIEDLLDEYTEAVESKEDFIAEHYFEQGFLVGRREGAN